MSAAHLAAQGGSILTRPNVTLQCCLLLPPVTIASDRVMRGRWRQDRFILAKSRLIIDFSGRLSNHLNKVGVADNYLQGR